MPPRPLIPALVAAILLAALPATASSLIDPGPFGPTRVSLADGRVIDVPAESHALYRMLTENGRLYGRHTPRPPEAEAQAGATLRSQHVRLWSARFGDRPRTPEPAYAPPVEPGWLSARPGFRPGHRAEDVFAAPGQRVLAPATMLIVHAGYLSKTAGEAVVGFIPAGDGQVKARYIALVHIDATPARARLGEVVEAGTVVGFIARGDEAVVGSALGRLPHVHFAIQEERSDGHLTAIPIWSLLRRTMHGSGRAVSAPVGHRRPRCDHDASAA